MNIIVIVWGLFGNMRNEVISAADQDKWRLPTLFPQVSWFWLVIAFLVLTLIAILEGSYRVHARMIADTYALLEGKTQQAEHSNQADPLRLLEVIDQHYETTKREPNVQPVHTGTMVDVYEGEHEVITEGKKDARGFQAMILSYHNKLTGARPMPKPRAIDNVSARLTYWSFDDNPSFSIPRGHWLSEQHNKMAFGKNDEHYLIIAVLEGDKLSAVERRFDGVHPDGTTMFRSIVGDLFRVNIRLMAELEGTSINNHDAMLEIKRDSGDVVLELTTAQFWRMGPLSRLIHEGYDLSNEMYKLEIDGQFKDERKDQLVEEIREWEARAATFIGQHISEQEKTAFLNTYPSIDKGLKNEFRWPVGLGLGGGGQTTSTETTPKYWSLHDSINSRVGVNPKNETTS